jgi:hypothetical protein
MAFFWGSHVSEYEEHFLLGCTALSSYRCVSLFTAWLLSLLFGTEDGASDSSETLYLFNKNTQCHSPEVCNVNSHCHGKLKTKMSGLIHLPLYCVMRCRKWHFAVIIVTGESLLPCAEMLANTSLPSVAHKPPICLPLPARKDVCFPADSPPHSPLPLPHYLHSSTLPHRRRYVSSDDPASLGMSYHDEIGSNVYVNADNTGSSAVYSCGSYTHLTSASPQLDLYQVGGM